MHASSPWSGGLSPMPKDDPQMALSPLQSCDLWRRVVRTVGWWRSLIWRKRHDFKDVQLKPFKMIWALKWLLKSCCFRLFSGKKTASVQLQPVGLCCGIGCVFTPLTKRKKKLLSSIAWLFFKKKFWNNSLFSFFFSITLTHYKQVPMIWLISCFSLPFQKKGIFLFLNYLSKGGKCNCERK